MAELLKVTTPLVSQSQAVPPKQGADPVNPFSLQATSRVLQPHNQSDVLAQNNGLNGGEGAAMLMDLLKDPSVAATYLKNIFLLEEVFKLLPANNETVTTELEQLFGGLLAQPGDVAAELVRQGEDATVFRGPFFDFLRELSDSAPSGSELPGAVANLLKAMNSSLGRRDVLDAAANNLGFLSKSLAPSSDLSGRLAALSERFRQEDVGDNFAQLKDEALALLREVSESILYSPKLAKNLSITVYNLSRYNDSGEFLDDAAAYLRQLLPAPQRRELSRFLADFRSGFTEGTRGSGSRVMETLTQLIGRQSGREGLSAGDEAKLDGILHSLLSSPCNFTPLLHFVVPTLFEDVRAFAEVWINPESGEGEMPEGAAGGRHLLLVIDVEGVGRFEAELFFYRRTVDLAIYAPPGMEALLLPLRRSLPGKLADGAYHLGRMTVAALEKPRSLMDVFKTLPYKRVGVDVKV